jgi:TPR repeat protein
VHYFKLSADQGDAIAQHRYGICLRDGIGVKKDPALAAHYLESSTTDQRGALTTKLNMVEAAVQELGGGVGNGRDAPGI